MPRLDRRHFLAASAAFGGVGMTLDAPALAQTPRRGGTLRVSVDQAVSKLNPLLTRVNPLTGANQTTFFRDFAVSAPRRRQFGVTVGYKF